MGVIRCSLAKHVTDNARDVTVRCSTTGAVCIRFYLSIASAHTNPLPQIGYIHSTMEVHPHLYQLLVFKPYMQTETNIKALS